MVVQEILLANAPNDNAKDANHYWNDTDTKVYTRQADHVESYLVSLVSVAYVEGTL